jgi:hypothetical protein
MTTKLTFALEDWDTILNHLEKYAIPKLPITQLSGIEKRKAWQNILREHPHTRDLIGPTINEIRRECNKSRKNFQAEATLFIHEHIARLINRIPATSS